MKKILSVVVFLTAITNAFSQSTIDRVNPFPKTITVAGSAEMEITPDEIYVVVDLREYDKKGQGKINIESIKSDFLQNCKDVGLPDSTITIASYEGDNNPWIRKKKKADLYASISYQIKFSKAADMDKLVAKLDDNATQNFQIVKTSHSKLPEFRKQLKIQAIKAAKEKGAYLSEAIGEKLGEAVTIAEPTEEFMPYYNQINLLGSANMKMAAQRKYEEDSVTSGGQQVEFKSIKLRFAVNVVFALK